MEEEANNNGSNTGMVRGTVRGDLYADLYNVNTDTNAVLYDLPLTEDETNTTRQIVVVSVRGSVTINDWINNVVSQLYPLDNRFVALKDEIADNLDSYIDDLSNPIIISTRNRPLRVSKRIPTGKWSPVRLSHSLTL